MILTITFLLGVFMGVLMTIRFHKPRTKQNKKLLKNMDEYEQRWKNKYNHTDYEAY